MITSEQKDLCIKLYLEGGHTIKEIIEETGLKYAPEVYQVLDEAGVPRKRKVAKNEKVAQQPITLNDSRRRFLFGMCRVYNNEPKNPYDEETESFKRYMWRNEWKILQDAQDPEFVSKHDLDNPRIWSEYFNRKIKAYIQLWTNPQNGENPRQWNSIYFNFKR